MKLITPILEHVADLTVLVGPPVEAGAITGLNSRGRRRIIPIIGGTVSGPMLKGEIVPGGADFQLVVSDTTAELDARYMLRLDSGESVYVHNRALRRGSAELMAKVVSGEPVDPALLYFRCVPSFEVSSGNLSWMTENVFVGTGARYPDRVEMAFFKVN
jgi:hypothetical protein